MEPIKTHRDLDVWKVAIDFAITLYKVTDTFPSSEKFCLTTQIRRAAVSISSNIAEGAARNHPKEFQQFLYHALGSVSEIETQLQIACRLGYLQSQEKEVETLTRLRKMLVSLIYAIRKKIQASQS
ncbi:MAG: four helix bundle protein [Bacteroidota bacterium]